MSVYTLISELSVTISGSLFGITVVTIPWSGILLVILFDILALAFTTSFIRSSLNLFSVLEGLCIKAYNIHIRTREKEKERESNGERERK